ncbi:MAG: EAL domain-containing protein [Muribaculaceae bacterium]|nr:EAL domain-containing protein [Roseburia sp.]MCM1431313.1 EAL domain-containing protein [Muribaculaceae bacterium]MCM1492201.1 EAL domain-containing protein [Muribaculaceae bacterium]
MADIGVKQQGAESLTEELVDVGILRLLQEKFCRTNQLYLACFDKEAGELIKPYGSDEELACLRSLVDEVEFMRLMRRMDTDVPENMQELALDEPYVKMCGVCTRLEGKPAFFWIAVAFLEDKLGEGDGIPAYMLRTTEERFYQSMEFLEAMSGMVFSAKNQQLAARSALKRSAEAESAVQRQLSRSQTMTEVVRSLESDDGFQSLIQNVIRETCMSLGIDGGCLIRADAEGKTADMVCEYVAEEKFSMLDKMQHQPIGTFPFFDGKPYLVSSDSMKPERFARYFETCGISAMLCMPLEVEKRLLMYLCFFENGREREWANEDVDFVNDVKHVVQSILSRRIVKNSLASSYAALEEILENAGCGIYVADYASRTILYMNQKLQSLFSQSIAAGKLDELVFGEQEVKRSRYCGEIYSVEEERWLDVYKTPISWVDGRSVSLCTLYDITDKKVYQKEIENRANSDFLTGLYNRMRCEQDLEECIKEAEAKKRQGALLYMDLDDFKHINDGLGHKYGDILLKAISHSLRHISGVENSCYRMGGDEFVILVPDTADAQLGRITQETMAIFSKPWFLKGEDYYCTMSMGIACFPTDGGTVEELIRKADMALLAAKRKGKNRVEYYSEKDDFSASRRLDMEKNMRAAALAACSEFEVYYQPIIDVTKEGTPCCGAEALVRWNSKEMGFVGPDAFIPLAEYLGLINPIGEHVLKKAAKRCKYWNDKGKDYKVNVNLSVVQLLQSDVVQKVKNVLRDSRLKPQNLTLEVTESLAIDDMDCMKRILSEIRDLGVRVALDDFGTGYSSLNHIREMPLDVIKIDRCFVEHLGEDDFSDAFVKMVAELAATIGVKVCVEGVETEKQLAVLSHMHIGMVQGYYFGKPMKLEEFERRYL